MDAKKFDFVSYAMESWRVSASKPPNIKTIFFSSVAMATRKVESTKNTQNLRKHESLGVFRCFYYYSKRVLVSEMERKVVDKFVIWYGTVVALGCYW